MHAVTPPTSMLEQALRYAAWGWKIFPIWPFDAAGRCLCGDGECANAGKHPRIKWGSGASSDPATVERWWRKWPTAGIGLACGPSGIVVVDIDGPRSEAEWLAMCAEGQAGGESAPATLEARTGRPGGGRHLYFRGSAPTIGRSGDAVDIRGEKGYAVLPPSPHASGRAYTWTVAAMPAPLPAFVARWAAGIKQHKATRGAHQDGRSVAPRYTSVPGAPVATRALRVGLDRAEVLAALAAVPASCNRQSWYTIGMALHWTLWPDAFEIWDAWSATCAEKYKPDNTVSVWNSFKITADGVTIKSLLDLARKCGWVWPPSETVTTSNVNGIHSLPAIVPQATVLGPSQAPIIFPDLDRNGRPRATCSNTRVALRALGIACRYDEFHDRFHVGGQALAQWSGQLTDYAALMVRHTVHERFRFDPPTTVAFEAAYQECLVNAFDPVRDYLDALAWDNHPRLATWLSVYLGAEQTALHAAIGTLVLVAAVRRVYEPGAKFDQITVLEGPEGRGKSSAIEILAGRDNFSDQSILTLDERGQQEALQGVWLYEIADLAGHRRAEIERVKAFASRTIDRARPAYARARVDRPRRSILFGTTNDDTYLKAQTGNRKFWPVRTGRIDLAALARDRDQLWAEAATIEVTGISLGLPAQFWAGTAVLQEARREHDPWEDKLADVKGRRVETVTPNGLRYEDRVSSAELFGGHLQLPTERQSDVTAKRVAYIMRRLGWDGPKPIRDGVTVFRGYTKTIA